MPGPRDYTPVTRTALAALSRGTCYYPGCERPVVVVLDGEPFVECQIAHIFDAKPGNRYDPRMSDDERRAFTNLIFLCKPHHDLVDKRHPERFAPEVLKHWKEAKEGDEVRLGDPSEMNEDVIEDALSQVVVINIGAGGLHLGGGGGNSVGAGGGGGGVIGQGTGGPGGHGAVVEVPDESILDLAGTAGQAPGAGGGGGGTLVPGVLLRRAKKDEGLEGRGWSDGVDGQDGGPSSIGDPDSGFFLEAQGGKAGLAGSGTRRPSDALSISMLSLVNSVEIRDGLVYVLGGAWQNCEVLNLGDHVRLCVVVVFEAGTLDPGDYTAAVSVEDAAGRLASTISFPVTVEKAGGVLRIPRVVAVDISATSFGIWRVSVSNDDHVMGFIDLMIKRYGVQTAPSS